MATAKRVVVNPADTDQKYVLWDNGRIEAFGGAPTITGNPTWYDWAGAVGPAAAIQITDWTTPAGYVLDFYGGIHPFGGAVAPAGPTSPYLAPFSIVVDFVMDPAGNGKGYHLDAFGTVSAFGGATGVAAGPVLAGLEGRRLVMQYSSKKYYVLDCFGGIHARQSAPTITSGPYWKGWDIARALEIYDWTTGKGWELDGWGGMHAINAAQLPIGYPYWKGWDIARDLRVIDDGTGAAPLEFVVLDGLGARHQFVVSTPPTAVVTGPVEGSTVTDTTRPDVTWSYSDPEGDAQYQYEVAIYGSADYAGFGSDADAFLTANLVVAAFHDKQLNRNRRGVELQGDLADGTYRAYVRVRDTAKQWSAVDKNTFTIDAAAPAVPVIVATAADHGVHLAISHASPDPLDLYYVIQYDLFSGIQRVVRGGGELDASSGSATLVDEEVPFGTEFTYYAYTYRADPRITSTSSTGSAITLTNYGWYLHAVGDIFSVTEVEAQEPFGGGRDAVAGVFRGVGAKFPIVVSDGALKASVVALKVRTLTKDLHDALYYALEQDDTLCLRSVLGEIGWYRIIGTVTRDLLRAAPTPSEDTPIRFSHDIGIPLVEVERPSVVTVPDLTVADPETDHF